MNFLPAERVGGEKGRTIGIRPECLRITDQGRLRATVTHVENLGGDTNVLAATPEGHTVTLRLFGQHHIRPDEIIGLDYDDAESYLFGSDGERVFVS